MNIYTKEYQYCLECFNDDKDFHSWEDIIDILQNYESEIHDLKDQIEELKIPKEEDIDNRVDELLIFGKGE